MHDTRDEPSEELARRWCDRFPALPGVGHDLIARYAESSRIYHDVRHLRDVLSAVDLLCSEGVDCDVVELGAWFHDAVYDVRRLDNETASAVLAEAMLTPYVEVERRDEVVRLVLLTREHSVADGDRNGAVLCDADLAILASEPTKYDDYVARVRAEYAHVAEVEFRHGRAAVLRRLLALPRLFNTRAGSERWEEPARTNLGRELSTL